MGLILDLYENLRKTKTKTESNKPKERNYTFDAGFSGDRKTDCNVCQTKKTAKRAQPRENNGREER